MEKIIINGNLYRCKDGTNAKIKELLHAGDKAPGMEHEKGIAHNDYNEYLNKIIDRQKGEYIENAYFTT